MLFFSCMERNFHPEQREVSMIAEFASEASRLVREKKASTLPAAIAQVLDKHRITHNRSAVFSQIASELGARGARKKALGKKSGPTIRSIQEEMLQNDECADTDFRRQEMFRDARAHELRQPASTWDPDHPENAP
jgi:hypothetical protein